MDFQASFQTFGASILGSFKNLNENVSRALSSTSAKTVQVATSVLSTEHHQPSQHQEVFDLIDHIKEIDLPLLEKQTAMAAREEKRLSLDKDQKAKIQQTIQEALDAKHMNLMRVFQHDLKVKKIAIRQHRNRLGQIQTRILKATEELQKNFNSILKKLNAKNPDNTEWIAKARTEMKTVNDSLAKLKLLNTVNPHTLASMSPTKIYEQIKNENIQNPEILFKLLKNIAKNDAQFLCSIIHTFPTLSQDHRFQLALIVAKQGPKDFLQSIEVYQLSDPLQRAELAKICVSAEPSATLKSLSLFDLTGHPSALLDVAAIALKEDPETAKLLINTFKLLDASSEDHSAALAFKKQLAICMAKNNPEVLVGNFHLLDIHAESERVEILSAIMPYCPTQLAQNFKNFKIESPENQFALVKLCAKQSARGACQYLANFGSFNYDQQLEIAKLAIAQKPKNFCRFLKSFDLITQLPILSQLALKCAAIDGSETSEWIGNFIERGLTDQKALTLIAETAIKKNAYGAAIHFAKYQIQDPEARTKLFVLCARINGLASAKCVKNFQLPPQNLVHCAKECARQCGIGTAMYIQEFGITDEKALAQIAQICARENGSGLAMYFGNFNISDPQARFQTAEIALQQSFASIDPTIIPKEYSSITCEYFANFKIENEKDRIKLAKIAAQCDALNFLKFIKNFDIQDEKIQNELQHVAGVQFALDFFSRSAINEDYFATLEADNLPSLLNAFPSLNIIMRQLKAVSILRDFRQEDLDDIQHNSLSIAKKMLGIPDDKLEWFKKAYTEEPNLLQKQKMLYHFLALLCALHVDKNLATMLQDPQNVEMLTLLITSKNFIYNQFLETILSIHTAPHAAGQELWTQFRSSTPPGSPPHLKIMPLLLSALAGESEQLLPICTQWLSVLNEKQSFYKHTKNCAPIYQVLFELKHVHPTLLPTSEKIKILNTLYQHRNSPQEFKRLCAMTRDLLRFRKAEFMAGIETAEDIENNLKEMFKNEFNLGEMTDFTEKYLATFGRFAMPEAIMTYAGSLRSLPQEQKTLLYLFVNSVLNGNYQAMRYAPDPHTQLVFKDNPRLKEKWIAGAAVPATELLAATHASSPRANNFFERVSSGLITAIRDQECLGKNRLQDYPLISQAIQIIEDLETSQDKLKALDGLRELAKKTISEKSELIRNEKDKDLIKKLGIAKTNAMIDALCLEILNPKNNELMIQRLLDKLSQVIPQKAPWVSDLMKQLSMDKKPSKCDGLTLVDTDDPNLLLLSGTYVETCQSVNGDPLNNITLQRTLCDPKIRMVALVNEDKEILARVLIKMLWDETEKKPVLFAENYYAINSDATYAKLVMQMCKKRAGELGVPLFLSSGYRLMLHARDFKVSKNTLSSFSGKEPPSIPEYVDSQKLLAFTYKIRESLAS